jgi:porin
MIFLDAVRWMIPPAFLLALAALPAAAQPSLECRPEASSEAKPSGLWERATLTGNWNGARDRLEQAGITFGLQELSEGWSNLGGGLRRGGAYNGQTTLSLSVDLEQAVGWTGGSFFANAYQLHGSGPTPNLVSSLQPVSGIEATRATRLFALWFEQTLPGNQVCIRIGQGGANEEFMLSRYGMTLINSSFGFPGLAALDLPSGGPNTPLSTPFVRVKFHPDEAFTLMAAVFNGDPAGRGVGDPQRRNPFGTDFRTHDHVFAIVEAAFAVNQEKEARYPGVYKFGAWFHSGRFGDHAVDTLGLPLADPQSSGVPRRHRGDYALYGLFDQMVLPQEGGSGRGIGVFALVSGAPLGDRNLIDFFATAGVNWKGPFEARPDDTLALGVAHARLGSSVMRYGRDLVAFSGGRGFRRSETVLEATYAIQIAPWWVLQPDIQYVMNPGAGMPNPYNGMNRAQLKNATIIGLRTGFVF